MQLNNGSNNMRAISGKYENARDSRQPQETIGEINIKL